MVDYFAKRRSETDGPEAVLLFRSITVKLLARIENFKHRIKPEIILPRIKCDGDTRKSKKPELM